MDRIIPSPISYKEPVSDETLAPIEDVLNRSVTSHNPGQTSNPTVLNPRYVSSPPITSVVGGQSSAQMVSVHSNAGGQPPARVALYVSGVYTSTI